MQKASRPAELHEQFLVEFFETCGFVKQSQTRNNKEMVQTKIPQLYRSAQVDEVNFRLLNH